MVGHARLNLCSVRLSGWVLFSKVCKTFGRTRFEGIIAKGLHINMFVY